ncbi:MAG: hypothetical protein MPEBLZ_04573 [Candidatus Methanoperedens nitroreducens]|uniref:Uncharacterized protein n=1 Tax=Candidatus Methanoperedens nitratireducens TaxID=1392998 RepID=A0A0P8C2Y5_9EURY|nr:MAG: hypothetical protein MPEBLZ_04573 [Candidatus Methanoperedens sp. BLZ1]
MIEIDYGFLVSVKLSVVNIIISSKSYMVAILKVAISF